MLISLDDGDPRPLYLQIAAAVKREIFSGALKPGDPLPSVRELSAMLEVNLHTVHKAYRMLRDEGIVTLRLGRGARVASPLRPPASPRSARLAVRERLRDLLAEAWCLGIPPREVLDMLAEEAERQEAPQERSGSA